MVTEFKNEYSWLSNFAPVKITLEGLEFPSVEHAYMSAKSDSIEWKQFCSNPENSAGLIKRKSREIELRSDWDNIKLKVMADCLTQKFNTEPFKTKLLETKNEPLQEGNFWNDKFWGVCLKTNVGENHLGKLIMKIRSSLHFIIIKEDNGYSINFQFEKQNAHVGIELWDDYPGQVRLNSTTDGYHWLQFLLSQEPNTKEMVELDYETSVLKCQELFATLNIHYEQEDKESAWLTVNSEVDIDLIKSIAELIEPLFANRERFFENSLADSTRALLSYLNRKNK